MCRPTTTLTLAHLASPHLADGLQWSVSQPASQQQLGGSQTGDFSGQTSQERSRWGGERGDTVEDIQGYDNNVDRIQHSDLSQTNLRKLGKIKFREIAELLQSQA